MKFLQGRPFQLLEYFGIESSDVISDQRSNSQAYRIPLVFAHCMPELEFTSVHPNYCLSWRTNPTYSRYLLIID